MKRFIGIIGLAVIAILLMGGAYGIRGGWRRPAVAKTDRPDKEEVAYAHVRDFRSAKTQPPGLVDLWWDKAVQDPCIMPVLFSVPAARPRPC